MIDFANLSSDASLRQATRPASQISAAHEGPAGGQVPRPALLDWFAAALNELDYGIVLLDAKGQVVHANEMARSELDDCHPLEIAAGELRARMGRDVAPLHEAISAACLRGLRKLLTLGREGQRVSVSVVPVQSAAASARAVLIVLGKKSMCESLSLEGFARSFGLTAAETRVLLALCEGIPPSDVATRQGVAISTVRSQIGSMRQKTGAESIRALVRQVAVLPPIKGILRRSGAAAGRALHREDGLAWA